jgi:hypothetical protein
LWGDKKGVGLEEKALADARAFESQIFEWRLVQ